MGIWNGIVMSDELQMSATIIYKTPYNSNIEWYGRGIAHKTWPDEQKHIETNIGNIKITFQNQKHEGIFIEFEGKGFPKGSLAETIGDE